MDPFLRGLGDPALNPFVARPGQQPVVGLIEESAARCLPLAPEDAASLHDALDQVLERARVHSLAPHLGRSKAPATTPVSISFSVKFSSSSRISGGSPTSACELSAFLLVTSTAQSRL